MTGWVATFRAVTREVVPAGLGWRRRTLLHPGMMRVLGTGQEIAAVTSSATFFSTVGLHFFTA